MERAQHERREEEEHTLTLLTLLTSFLDSRALRTLLMTV